MKVTFTKKNLIWVLLYYCLLTVGFQYWVSYPYRDINNHIADFIYSEIKAEKIIRIVDLPYSPGVGTYREILLESNRGFPLFIEDQEDKINLITPGQTIIKNANSKEFYINNGSKLTKYNIRTLKAQEKNMRIFILAMSIIVLIAGLLKYNIRLTW